MEKELFRKTEKALYEYYKDKNVLAAVRKEIDTLNNLLKIIDKNIVTCNVNIDPYQPGMGEGERVQSSSSNSSYVEKAIIKAIDDMEKEKAQRIRKLYKLLAEERDLVYKISKIDNYINRLNDESIKFIELKYNVIPNEKISMLDIAFEMNMCKTKAYELRKELIKDLATYIRMEKIRTHYLEK